MKCMILLLLTLGLAQGTSKSLGNDTDSSGEPMPRIYNGENAEKGEFPFMARIKGYGWDHYCGGILVSDTVVLTAAHCAMSYTFGEIEKPSEFSVFLGDFSIDADDDGQIELTVHQVFIHPDFVQRTLEYDMAAFILSEKVTLKPGVIETIDIYSEDERLGMGEELTVIGWGGTENLDSYWPDILQKLTYPISDQEACAEWWGDSVLDVEVYEETMFCTGEHPLLKHSWFGDSGGPLVWKKPGDEKYMLYGLVSWGVPNPDKDAYDVNAYVPAMLGFIDEVKDIEADNYLILENPSYSATKYYSGIAVFYEVGEKPYTICTDGMTNPEATAKAICKNVGFNYGMITTPLLYKKKKKHDLTDVVPSFGKVKLSCKEKEMNIFKCDAIDYAFAKTPCFEQDLLAVKCWNGAMEGFTFSVDEIEDQTTEMTDGTSSGKVLAKITAVKNGYKINPKKIDCSLYNAEVDSDGNLIQMDHVGDMKHKNKLDKYSTKKIKGKAQLQKKCLVVVCFIEPHKFHAIKCDRTEACGDDVETLETDLVPAWIKENQENW